MVKQTIVEPQTGGGKARKSSGQTKRIVELVFGGDCLIDVSGKRLHAEMGSCHMLLTVSDTAHRELACWLGRHWDPRVSGSLTFVDGETGNNGTRERRGT
jgi:hypothetical protein